MLVHRPLLPTASDDSYFISGEVEVALGADIAAGVLLMADPDCRLQIQPGVCIGTGSVLHAQGGLLTVETGATLGSAVLIIGQATIGSHACIGSASTLLNHSVLPDQIVPPASLLGDASYEPAPSMGEVEAVRPDPLSPTATVERTIQPPVSAIHEISSLAIPGQAHLNRLLHKIYPYRNLLVDPVSDAPQASG